MLDTNFKKGFSIPFTQIPNSVLYAEEITFKAKAIWCYLNSKPDGWHFAAERISKETADGEDAIKSGIRELINKGYLKAERQSTGRIEYTLLLPQPQNPVLGYEPQRENPPMGKSPDGKIPPISNTDNKVKKIINKKESKKEISFSEVLDKENVRGKLRITFWEFIRMRNMIKAPLTDKALELAIKKARSYAKDDSEAVKVVEQSIERSWRGIFPLGDVTVRTGGLVDLNKL